MTTTPRKFYEADCDHPTGGDKERTPMAELIKRLKAERLSNNIDNPLNIGLTVAISEATSLLEAERKMGAVIWQDGCLEGISATNNPFGKNERDFDVFFTSKYTQQ